MVLNERVFIIDNHARRDEYRAGAGPERFLRGEKSVFSMSLTGTLRGCMGECLPLLAIGELAMARSGLRVLAGLGE